MITDDQERLLCLLAEAYNTPGRHGEREPIIFTRSTGGTGLHHDALDGVEWDRRPGIGDLEELDAEGLISMTWTQAHSGNFRVTAEGLIHAGRVRQQRELAERGVSEADMEWVAGVLPVLRAVVDAYDSVPTTRGVSQDMVNERLGRPVGDDVTDRVLFHLERDGFISGHMVDQLAGPVLSIPTPKAFRLTRGWPVEGGEPAAAAFVAAIEAVLSEARSDEERTKLQRLLEVVRDVGQGVLAEALTRIATRAV